LAQLLEDAGAKIVVTSRFRFTRDEALETIQISR
jgi:hypothetical protein